MSEPAPPRLGRRALAYAACGGLLGACLTVTGYLVDYSSLYGELPPSLDLELVNALHDVTPLHWFADLYALVLALAAGLAGWYQDRAQFFAGQLERRRIEEHLRHIALHDRLTGLPSRGLLASCLEGALESARTTGKHVAVLHLGIDRFKAVNESLGVTVGDDALVCLARGLAELLEAERGGPAEATGFLLFRVEGDEFVAVLDDVASLDEAKRVASRILAAHERPLRVQEREILLSLSIGIALGMPATAEAAELLQNARSAMKRSKALGRARFEVVEREGVREADSRHLETELYRALTERQIVACYQPIHELRSRRLDGFEALVRWNHPDLGSISPATFIPVAEASGLIARITRHMFRDAFERLALWQERFPRQTIGVNVNLSPAYLYHPDLEPDLVYLLCESGADASRIHLEITESTLIDDPERAIEVLGRLKHRGFRIAVDDFGTGYSSLSMLHALPVDVLKLDHAFVAKILDDEDARQIVASIVDLAKKLELEVVGEGIESEEQLEELRGLGCRYGQGYLLGRPMDADAAEERIATAAASSRRRARASAG
jgi:diguanylate cyclase (GGDEF)-like protein